MSKSTKIIAALGVVAGLGVAALPLSSYATEGEVSGNVTISATITDSIAMRIQSNSDSTNANAQSGYGVVQYNPSSMQNSGDPTATTGPSLASVSLAANTYNYDTLYSDIEVRSNTGYFKVTLQDADTTNTLDGASASIPAVSTESAQPGGDPTPSGTLSQYTAGWGYHVGAVAEQDAASAVWNAVPTSNAASADTIVEHTASNWGGTATKVVYGVATGQTATGTYTDTVVYTATTDTANNG